MGELLPLPYLYQVFMRLISFAKLMLASDIKMTLIGFRKGARRCVRTKVGYKLI